MSRWTRYDKSLWQQNRERLRLTDSHPAPPEPDISIRKTILDVFAMMNAGEQSVWRQVEQAWSRLAGPMIARHARPVRLDQKTLVVAVDNSVWLNELIRYERLPLLTRLQHQVGKDKITAIRFQADPQAVSHPHVPDHPRVPLS